jgi:hypothetical protein
MGRIQTFSLQFGSSLAISNEQRKSQIIWAITALQAWLLSWTALICHVVGALPVSFQGRQP